MSQSRPPDARIAELTQKKSQLDAQIAALDARRRLSQKKDEDRIKWLLGTLVFDRLSAEPACLMNIPAFVRNKSHRSAF
jgi:hypothetical protein